MSLVKEYTVLIEVRELGQSEARKPVEVLEKKMSIRPDCISSASQTPIDGETEIITNLGMCYILKEDYEVVVSDWLSSLIG